MPEGNASLKICVRQRRALSRPFSANRRHYRSYQSLLRRFLRPPRSSSGYWCRRPVYLLVSLPAVIRARDCLACYNSASKLTERSLVIQHGPSAHNVIYSVAWKLRFSRNADACSTAFCSLGGECGSGLLRGFPGMAFFAVSTAVSKHDFRGENLTFGSESLVVIAPHPFVTNIK